MSRCNIQLDNGRMVMLVSLVGITTLLGLQSVDGIESDTTNSQDSIRSHDRQHNQNDNNNNNVKSDIENIIYQNELNSLPIRGTASSLSSIVSIWIRLALGIEEDDGINENSESLSDSLVFGWWIVVSVIVALILAITISLVLGKQWYITKRKNQNLSYELETAHAKLRYLQEKLQYDDDDDRSGTSFGRSSSSRGNNKNENDKHQQPKEIRIFMDGAFDLLHFGHMNAFRLARSLGTHLVVGVNSDESITQCKGPPLLNDEQRLVMVSSCKFVDDVVPNCPYIMNADYLDWVIKTYDIDYVVHGDDPCFVDGVDVYAAAKASGKFRTIPRTAGVSTTDIVGRMLVLTKEHHYHVEEDEDDVKDDDDENDTIEYDTENVISIKESQNTDSVVLALISSPTTPLLSPPSSTIKRRRRANSTSSTSSAHRLSNNNNTNNNTTGIERMIPQQSPTPKIQSRFLTTSRMLQLFSADVKAPTSNMKIVYIDGSWDLFHPGHVRILQKARERGDYLLVGVHGDALVNKIQGMNLPLMNLHERVLSILGCRYVNDVIIDAPFVVTEEMITSFRINEVVYGGGDHQDNSMEYGYEDIRYKKAQELGIYTKLSCPTTFRISSVIQRIQKNQETFQAKFERKMAAEQQYYTNKLLGSNNDENTTKQC